MSTAVRTHGPSHLKAQLAMVIMGAFRSAAAMRHCVAAHRDEKNGFPLTPALEWRKAAELVGAIGKSPTGAGSSRSGLCTFRDIWPAPSFEKPLRYGLRGHFDT